MKCEHIILFHPDELMKGMFVRVFEYVYAFILIFCVCLNDEKLCICTLRTNLWLTNTECLFNFAGTLTVFVSISYVGHMSHKLDSQVNMTKNIN